MWVKVVADQYNIIVHWMKAVLAVGSRVAITPAKAAVAQQWPRHEIRDTNSAAVALPTITKRRWKRQTICSGYKEHQQFVSRRRGKNKERRNSCCTEFHVGKIILKLIQTVKKEVGVCCMRTWNSSAPPFPEYEEPTSPLCMVVCGDSASLLTRPVARAQY